MFLRFFLSHYDQSEFFVAGGISNSRQTASSHNQYKVEETPTFERLKTSLARRMNRISQHSSYDTVSREILINVEDSAMFQLEALCVPEYSFCTFNLETRKIGFGNTASNAYRATWSGDTKNYLHGSGVVGSSSKEKDYFFNFYPESVEKEKRFVFTCPDNFYDQVLEVLRPYIIFEKNFIFKEVTYTLECEGTFLDNFFDSFMVKDSTVVQYCGTTLMYGSVCITFDMFMNDDPDILSHSEMHTSGLKVMGALCLKMMQISNETF